MEGMAQLLFICALRVFRRSIGQTGGDQQLYQSLDPLLNSSMLQGEELNSGGG